jgi:hypothetical protein
MLSELKNWSANRMDIDELVEFAAMGRALQAEFTALGVEPPEWLDENLTSIHREIKAKNHDRLAAKLRSAKARLETLKTPDEKRTGLQATITEIEKQLAVA